MRRDLQRKVLSALILTLPSIYASEVYAAKPVDLSKQPITVLQSAIMPTKGALGMTYTETSRSLDANGTLHTRIQQQYQGHPVWGGDAIVHVPEGSRAPADVNSLIASAKNNTSMDGTMYQDLTIDLAKTPAYVFNQAQADAAMQQALALFNKQNGTQSAINDKTSELIVYVDNENKAHWAYKVTFYAEPLREDLTPIAPSYILDAISFKLYTSWNNVKTVGDQAAAIGGGYGGNTKMGRLVYDGTQGNYPTLSIKRDSLLGDCFLSNDKVTVKHYKTRKIIKFKCKEQQQEHPNLYWDGDLDKVNGGYSPANDALRAGAVIVDMYQQWYGIPVLTQSGKPMMLGMVVHKAEDNAFWDGKQMTFGDGVKYFYPLTSLGVGAHEISHGFTEQHSNLNYRGQSGGMNEAFSDMAAQAAEFFAYGKASWQIGSEIFKMNRSLRYMDYPTRDCRIYGKPGVDCSIRNVSQYVAPAQNDPFGDTGTDVHYSSGIYNRAFYLIATSEGWGVRKAFDVMVDANRHYWTSHSTFASGACGVLKAAKSLGYDKTAIIAAFKDVGVKTDKC